MCFLKPNSWAKWLPQAEWWYNTKHHTALGLTPFEALYGYKPPMLNWEGNSTVNSVQEIMHNRQQLNKILKEQLLKAQNRMKQCADKKRSERTFQEGDEVYLKLQPYKQSSLAIRNNVKLAARFYGPYTVKKRIGLVAYELDLPSHAKLYLVFHVSLLKKKVGANVVTSLNPPKMDDIGQLKVYPALVLDKRMVKRNNEAVTQLLIQWSNLRAENATWEDYTVLKSQFLKFDSWGQ
ncbi:hypothetical protein HRI_004714000 [Hibiscus trionum]|uniref:Tf2-1-like SH3-like domain-containing protein n=1 Tax=Hibiscus trionum TaxID=183268 RepID=A0A9W7MMF7_HIBTR|nr:hypothetical protein HRI_004714000 [Hibiscus trionum]